MDAAVWISLVGVLVLGATHVQAWRFDLRAAGPRSWLLSFGGGVSVAYVFVYLLPEVAEGQEVLAEAAEGGVLGIDRHAYIIALAGLAVFYGVERAAVRNRATSRRPTVVERHHATEGGDLAEEGTDRWTFAISLVAFGVYNALIGYLLVQRAEDSGAGPAALFVVALGVHLVVNDLGLRAHHRRRYHDTGRWILGAALLAGWALGLAIDLGDTAIAALTAFLGGAIVLNVLKEELPEERESRFWPFLVGAFLYAAVLLTV
jgi:hypothetical protein